MKFYVRFLYENTINYGLLKGERITLLKGADFSNFEITTESYDLNSVELITPCTPSKAVCVGFNYTDTELDPNMEWPEVPLLFLKPPSSIINNGSKIIQYPMVKDLACEAELAVVIGKKAHRISQDEVKDYIWGFTIANDVTAKDIQKADGLWTRSKSFDTFLPIGPWIVRGIDHKQLGIRSYINGCLVQEGNTSNLLFNVEYLISYISQVMTLLPGDLILTGTPGGQGSRVQNGDKVEIEIEKIGNLVNEVAVLP